MLELILLLLLLLYSLYRIKCRRGGDVESQMRISKTRSTMERIFVQVCV